MKVELIDYTKDGINKIARLARATRKTQIEESPKWTSLYHVLIHGNEEYLDWEKDNEKFVKALMKVKHDGVLEHVNFTFHVSEISRALTHQLVRHRIGFSYLQMSNRHARPNEHDFVIPESFNRNWLELGNKPTDDFGSDYAEGHLIEDYELWMKKCYEQYIFYIKQGIPVEDARYVLPPAFFTHISFSCNTRSLRNFLELRLAKSAQWEIRNMACQIFDVVYSIYPLLFKDLKPLRDTNEN